MEYKTVLNKHQHDTSVTMTNGDEAQAYAAANLFISENTVQAQGASANCPSQPQQQYKIHELFDKFYFLSKWDLCA